MMNPGLQKQFDYMEKLRKEILNELGRFNDAQLKFKPAPESWSILQVLHHLLTAEKRSYQYMAKKSKAETLPKVGWQSELRSKLLKISLSLPVKFKAPAVLPHPSANINFSSICQEWDESRIKLKEFASSLPEEKLHAGILKHPIAGYLSISQTLAFMKDHFQHHLKQIQRIQKVPHFPR